MACFLKDPIHNIFFSKTSSKVFLNSLVEELLLGQMINLKLLSKGVVLDCVNLGHHNWHSSSLQDFSSLGKLGVTLMLVEISEHKLMLFHHFFKVVFMEVNYFIILKNRLFSELWVLRVFQISVTCNGMFRVLGIKRVSVFLFKLSSLLVLGIVALFMGLVVNLVMCLFGNFSFSIIQVFGEGVRVFVVFRLSLFFLDIFRETFLVVS